MHVNSYYCHRLCDFQINLNRPMNEVLAELTKYPIKTRLSLTGTLVVARDIAHAKLKERIESGQGLPDYIKNHPVYYAGPAKTPEVLYAVLTLKHWDSPSSLIYGTVDAHLSKPSLGGC